jgi:uncharacterized protein DUF6220
VRSAAPGRDAAWSGFDSPNRCFTGGSRASNIAFVLQPYARSAFRVGVWVVAALVVVQFLLAGLGIFVSRDFLTWHATANGAALFFLPLILLLLAWLGAVPWRVSRLAPAITGLVALQSILLIPYHLAAPEFFRAISGLHVVNALFIAWVAMRLIEETRGLATPLEAARHR